jgi:hypothetical protein
VISFSKGAMSRSRHHQLLYSGQSLLIQSHHRPLCTALNLNQCREIGDVCTEEIERPLWYQNVVKKRPGLFTQASRTQTNVTERRAVCRRRRVCRIAATPRVELPSNPGLDLPVSESQNGRHRWLPMSSPDTAFGCVRLSDPHIRLWLMNDAVVSVACWVYQGVAPRLSPASGNTSLTIHLTSCCWGCQPSARPAADCCLI